ncbi:TRAP transporter fused permease subunit [Aquicoccus sp. SCR17]|nr:TRAP transporter fused permease subunit [Carideicomes alvinocaridis]
MSLISVCRVLSAVLLFCVPILGIAFTLDLGSRLGVAIWREQATLAILGFAVAGGAAQIGSREGLRFGDAGRVACLVMAALALLACGRAALEYEHLVAVGYLGFGPEYMINLALAAAGIAVLVVVTTIISGWVLAILAGVFFAYAMVADQLPGFLGGQAPEFDFLLGYLFLDSSGILGTALSVVVSVVVPYVLLGTALFKFGGGDLFIDLSLATMGRFRGGSAKASIVASSLFGSVSGSAVANVVTTGIVTIPLMRKGGFSRTQAGAVEAVASTGGQLLPPVMGAAAFIMADTLGVSYAEVALAGLVPALLFYLAVFLQVHLHALKLGLEPLPRAERPSVRRTLRTYWMFLIPIFLLIYLLFFERMRPELAALWSICGVLLAGVVYNPRQMTLGAMLDMLLSTGRALLDVLTVTAVAGLIIGILSITGLSFSLGLGILEASGSSIALLLLASAITAIIFGMGMPTTAVYVLLAALIAPALTRGGIDPMAAHLFLLYFGVLSMITPPVCLAAFAAASVARAPLMRTGWQSAKLGAVAFVVPFLFVASPVLLMQDAPLGTTIRTLGTGGLGCIFFAAAVEGYLMRPLGAGLRLLAAAGGLMMLAPDGALTHSAWAGNLDWIGLAICVAVAAMAVATRHREPVAVTPEAAE